MSISPNQQFEQTSIYSDLNSLNAIRKQGQTDQQGAMKKAAKEFEAFFMNMMLKSMRQASEVIGENPLTGSDEEKMFTGMMDEQMSISMSQQGHLGIAELMISQLSRDKSSETYKTFNLKSEENKVGSEQLEREANKKTNSLNDYRQSPVPHQIDINHLPVNPLPEIKLLKEVGDDQVKNVQVKNDQVKTENLDMLVTDKVKNIKVQPEKKSLFVEVTDFISTLLPHAKEAAKKLNVDPKILLAQAALETGWGKFIMHDDSGKPGFNLFGIKADKSWNGESIKINTLEVENQQFKKVNASFRKYQSFSDSFNDYVSFLKQNPRYQKALESSENADNYIKQLQSSGYATDPNYAAKILRIFKDTLLNKVEASK